jgi:hypothetical protein
MSLTTMSTCSFAQLAIAHPGMSIGNITNPYLIGAPKGFFEAPGLLLMPVYLHYALPFLGLVMYSGYCSS